jgi:hypothetical protein
MKIIFSIFFLLVFFYCQSQIVDIDTIVISKSHQISVKNFKRDGVFRFTYSVVTFKSNLKGLEIIFTVKNKEDLLKTRFDSLILRSGSGQVLSLYKSQDTIYFTDKGDLLTKTIFRSKSGTLEIFQTETIYEIKLGIKEKAIIFKFKENTTGAGL